jgi:phosphoribosylamine--glycine ligase
MANVLVIGSGGREHALGVALGKSPAVKVFYAPGNAGTQFDGTNVSLDITDHAAIAKFIAHKKIALTVVGPEKPLVNGLVDYLRSVNRRVFGPTAYAAQLESDKFFSYQIMKEFGISQAEGVSCQSLDEAKSAITRFHNGVVLKARGLTDGKGVSVFDTQKDALASLNAHVARYGNDILVSERLFGEEFSIFGICDGETVSPIYLSAQDHKTLFDNDKGPNTGGMGAYSPAPIADARVIRQITDSVLLPLVQGMKERGSPYTGFIYAGMMMTKEGPKTLEFNVRFGDPECQPIMQSLRSGLFEEISDAVDGKISTSNLQYNMGASCCVVLTVPGYPKNHAEGAVILGLEDVASMPHVKVFHAGTTQQGDQVVTSGGRVLGVTAHGMDIRKAQQRAYAAVKKISIPGGFHYRKDIADKALRRM